MATTNGNRKILDLKRWEMCCPVPVAKAAGACVASSNLYRQLQLYLVSSTVAYLYDPAEDGFVQIPSPALAGTFGAGVSAVAASVSTGSTASTQALTATAGTTTTITTNQTLARDLRGYSVRILSGPNAGQLFIIASNTIGANAVITFTTTAGSAFGATTVYQLLTPRWYVIGAGTLASGSFKAYDFATNTWIVLSNTGLPATIGVDSKLKSTPSFFEATATIFASGTATAGAASTLTNGAKTWTTNQWSNYQIRITAGVGVGQIRNIASNTGTVITVSAAWTTTPDATSQYEITGSDDYIYYLGNGAVTMYRYQISTNLWTTLAPGVARAGLAGAGMSASWLWNSADTAWTNESNILNGRFIYSFRGGASAVLDVYDIALNTWAAVPFSPGVETFTTGTNYEMVGDEIFLQKEVTGRWFKYKCVTNEMTPWGWLQYPHGAAIVGDTVFDVFYRDGATTIRYIYIVLNSSTVMLRQMII